MRYVHISTLLYAVYYKLKFVLAMTFFIHSHFVCALLLSVSMCVYMRFRILCVCGMHCTVYVLCIICLFVYFVPDKHEKTANFIKINSQPLQNINSLQMQQSAAKWVFFVYALCMLSCQCIQMLCVSVSVAYKWAEHVILYNFKCLPSKWEKKIVSRLCVCVCICFA